ncbi:hypothetical protein RHGRI_023336 [Rhododendron griersonianum]|uniref:Uncharacterized protein n=1 Tax=Rhododendron griersonianum TaxID=479676 RepID=A0AAV6J2Y9_9ERIC|nr:hypothetical protein RHGRI_023336 [Rhododendron griersonianum]
MSPTIGPKPRSDALIGPNRIDDAYSSYQGPQCAYSFYLSFQCSRLEDIDSRASDLELIAQLITGTLPVEAEAMAKEKQKGTVADKGKKKLTTAGKRKENSCPVVQVIRERNTGVVIRDEQDIMRLRELS